MSYHFKGPEGTLFNYNADLSGNVQIFIPRNRMEITDRDGSGYVNIPGKDLLAFVAEYIRMEKISALENADMRSLFGLLPAEN